MSHQANTKPQRHSVPIPLRLLLLVLIITAIVKGYGAWQQSKIDPNTLKLSGTVEATEADVAPRVSGRIVKLFVDEGDSVKAGQPLAILQADELGARVEQAQGFNEANQAKLKELQQGTRAERIKAAQADLERAKAVASGAADVEQTIARAHKQANELKSSYVTAMTNVRIAQKDADSAMAQQQLVKSGPRQEQIDALKASEAQLAAIAKNAQQDAQRADTLLKAGAISQQQRDTAITASTSAQDAHTAAEARLREALAGSRAEEIANANAKVEQAMARLQGAQLLAQNAKQMYDDRLDNLQRLQNARSSSEAAAAQVTAAQAALDLLVNGPDTNDLNAAKGGVKQSAAALSEAKYMSQQIVITAPFDGVVTTKYREIGEVLTPGASIVRVANITKLWVRVYAPLTSLGRFRIGDGANIITESLPGQQIQAKVASISQEPEFTPKNVQTSEERVKLVYALRLNIDNTNQRLKPGMPVDALIAMQPATRK